jgi:hypothetical protein
MPALRASLVGNELFQEVQLDAINRRGKAITCRVTCTPMRRDGSVTGVILMMEKLQRATALPAPASRRGNGKKGQPHDGQSDGKAGRPQDAQSDSEAEPVSETRRE